MSHEVEIVDGKASLAYAGEVPWHGLGKSVSPDLTPEQILKEARLDWKVEKFPLVATFPGLSDTPLTDELGNPVVTGRSALVRSLDNSILDVVSDDWNPVQNSEAFEFFHEFVMAGDMEMNTAGSLHSGRIVWALAKVKESFETVPGDVVESHLLFTNPHKYGKSTDVRFTPIRVVCANTLAMALQKATNMMVKVNHRRKFDSEEVKKALGIATGKLRQYEEASKFLVSKRYTDESLKEFINEIFPTTGKKEKDYSRAGLIVANSVMDQPGAEFGEGTWWQAFNAVTYSIDHKLGNSQDTRLRSAWYGENREKKILALKTAVKYAEVA